MIPSQEGFDLIRWKNDQGRIFLNYAQLAYGIENQPHWEFKIVYPPEYTSDECEEAHEWITEVIDAAISCETRFRETGELQAMSIVRYPKDWSERKRLETMDMLHYRLRMLYDEAKDVRNT